MTEEKGHVGILDVDIEEQMKDSYLDYAMSVIVARALPDVRDGLKPVHRRIIYGMHKLGLTPDKAYRKSAALVGDVMGKYHPHGDSAIYDAVVRLAQDFNTRYLLADGQGNFGSVDGDGAAAMRYTEIRMTKLTTELLRDLGKETVDFQPNYDESEEEPVVLPSRFPNLLVNGSTGIAVGMATNMAPHNLVEVTDAITAYLDDEEIELSELMKMVKGPDFPTGAWIMGQQGIKDAYKTGRGKVIIRAVAKIEELKNRERIIVSEIPYQVNKSNLIIKIAELVKEKRIEGISDLRDESDRRGMRIVIELKRDANANVVLNNLYKYTQMQVTFGIINLALVNGEPKVLNLKELISHYTAHQIEVVTRRTKYDLRRAEARAHIIEGLKIAIDNIDEIIKIIRSNYSDVDIKKIFFERFGLSDLQSQAILDMQLKRLSGLEREKLDNEYEELIKEIARLKEILENDRILRELIKQELREIADKYGDERRTELKPDAREIDTLELIEREEVLITLTNEGYIKRQPADNYKVQQRGGKGIVGLTTKEGDFVESMFVTTTHDTLLFFTNQGKVFSLKAYEIPEGRRQAKGQAIINLLNISKDEKVTAVIPLNADRDQIESLVFATAKGLVKKTPLDMFQNIRKSGIWAISLKEDDELIAVRYTSDEAKMMLITEGGMSIKFELSDIRPMGRTAAGVIGIRLNEGDRVVSMEMVDDSKYLLVISEYGFGKKTLLGRYKVQNRGGKGIKTYKISKKTGQLVAAKIVDAEDDIIAVSLQSDIIRLSVKEISTQGRDTSGVKLKDINRDNDRIVAVAKYIDQED
ncbi:DNA gyrase subunit A [Microaceticoccus formicicus]|uniref:DNA gyrase subunit A n=1 Tax=Microaceticoccus formicicus TaxID=3118105 RepID=UPI003CD02025|nr:DNA gyrase subunit A [Peptoniphilaceae bacterium AMB_02]